ncbi:flavin reductase [Pseudoroseomonas deserti]|uniref:Flavin reductase n=1 Tax=Teichococcus deserti TaxID=1817963 RepID=A0A1V2H826_9PROT|nr:flavin reductase family protein [Pseudoroseomonas deserti]ONG56641.1 flavin reductase [Pseudoroseomonas deserti]
MTAPILAVPLDRAYRLLNHGPTVLVSARHGGVDNVMAAAWCCALDFSPPKLTVVLDRVTATRGMIEASGVFAIQVPTVAQAALTKALGSTSLGEDPAKLARAGVRLFDQPGHAVPLVEGCSAWLSCRLLPEPHIQDAHDLFVAEVTGAWADARVFAEGRWTFETADPSLRSLHYVAGGRFYATGEAIDVGEDAP